MRLQAQSLEVRFASSFLLRLGGFRDCSWSLGKLKSLVQPYVFVRLGKLDQTGDELPERFSLSP